jgi:F-type H+-transporting ATPase subunit b
MFGAANEAGLLDSAKEIGRQFGVDGPHFISQVISFAIVAFLLHRFAYKPILRVLEERRQRIAESLANAEKIKQELAKAEAMRQEILGKANTQANQLIEEARAAAAKVQESETQRAIKAAEDIIVKAQQAAVAERQRTKDELLKELGHMVVRTAAQVTGKILTMDDQKRLIDETNKQLAA